MPSVTRVHSHESQIYIDNTLIRGVRSFSYQNPKNVQELRRLGSYKQEDYILTVNSYKLSKPTNSKCETEKLSNIVVSMHQGLNTAGEKVKFASKGIPVLQTRNITSGKIDFKNMKYVDENTYKKYSSKFTITKNDILLANIGTIGKSLIVKTPLYHPL